MIDMQAVDAVLSFFGFVGYVYAGICLVVALMSLVNALSVPNTHPAFDAQAQRFWRTLFRGLIVGGLSYLAMELIK
jgi:hypothetical protein